MRASQGRSSIELLAHLAATLPIGTAMTHLQVDSTGGSMVVLTSSTDGVMKGLAQSPLFVAPEIVGPVTRERVGNRELERLSLRFRHRVAGDGEGAP